MNLSAPLRRSAGSLAAAALLASPSLAQANDFVGGSAADSTDWFDAANWSNGTVPGASFFGPDDFCRMTAGDAVVDSNWTFAEPFPDPATGVDSGLGYNTNVAVGFQTTNSLLIRSGSFFASHHVGGIAIGKKANGNGTVIVEPDSYFVSIGEGGIKLGTSDATARGTLLIDGTVRTRLLALQGAGSVATINAGGRIQWPEPTFNHPFVDIQNDNVLNVNSNVNFGVVDLFPGHVVANGSQFWARYGLLMDAGSTYTGTGGGKLLLGDTPGLFTTSTIDGVISNDGILDLRADHALVLGPDASISGTTSHMQLRNGSTVTFQVDSAFQHANLSGSGFELWFGVTPGLVVEFEQSPQAGDSFELFSGVSGFMNFDGSLSGFEFGSESVTGLDAGLGFDVVYDSLGQRILLEIGVGGTFGVEGSGCPTSAGLTATLSSDSIPTIGETMEVVFEDLTPGAIPFGMVGYSDTVFQGVPLPLPANLFFPGTGVGCDLTQSADLLFPLVPVGGSAVLPLPIPNNPDLVGAEIHVQGLQFEFIGGLWVAPTTPMGTALLGSL